MEYKDFLDFHEEYVNVEEEINWLQRDSGQDVITPSNFWILEGELNTLTVENETEFCDPELVQQVLYSKNALNKYKESKISRARSRSNPFEAIKGGIFQNRAAMKMANLDAVFDYIFTNPKTKTGDSEVAPDEVLYFADVCGGPGGFSEYIFWRKKWEAKGFGFTLKSSNDFCLDNFLVAPSECMDLHYGENGIDGDGDIYKERNISEFAQYVLSQTDRLGVHVMVADGGFSVDGNENMQEVLSKQIYLCQCLVAVSILREGGHFLCKMFDLFTSFSAGLVYLMHNCFEQISIHKPNTSRPANSERFLVCKWKRRNTSAVKEFLITINQRINSLKATPSKRDIVEIVPWDILKSDDNFLSYLRKSNNLLCQRQIYGLKKIAAYCEHPQLLDHRQKELRKQCLELWRIPDKSRNAQPRILTPGKVADSMLTDKGILHHNMLLFSELPLPEENFSCLSDWTCILVGLDYTSEMRTFFLGLGRLEVFFWKSAEKCWKKLSYNLELPQNTLIYGELIIGGSTSSQDNHVPSLHLIDAIYISGLNVSYFALTERRKQLSKLAKSLNKPSRCDLVKLFLKPQYPLETADVILRRYFIKPENARKEENLTDGDSLNFFEPVGLIIYRPIAQMEAPSAEKKIALPASNFFDCFKSQIGWWPRKNASMDNSFPCSNFLAFMKMISFRTSLE